LEQTLRELRDKAPYEAGTSPSANLCGTHSLQP